MMGPVHPGAIQRATVGDEPAVCQGAWVQDEIRAIVRVSWLGRGQPKTRID